MTKISSREENGEYVLSIRVDKQTLMELDMSPSEFEHELRRIFIPKPKPPVEALNDIDMMFVDHLVVNLERHSVFQIVIFLSRYCGWDRIKKYMDEYLSALEGKENAKTKPNNI